MTSDTPGRPTVIHLVPHTHWDREWYRPFQSFRTQLVDLVDRVLDMLDADLGFAFTLDGQLATVDDYLEIRPESAERIARHVRSGRLAVGPWLILMDEFLVSGETLVRNLEAGWRRAEDFGRPMQVGYLPDMFGHIAQMPQLLRRAGLRDAIVWRGVPAAVDRHAFRWESPDGSWVRAEYLPVGYGNAAYLFTAPDALGASRERFLAAMAPWFGTDAVLAMYGTDHTAPVRELLALVTRLNELETDASVQVGTLADYIAAAPALAADAPRWRGELRSAARANLLMGVASARVDIKAAAGHAERALERYAEPLSALHLPREAWPDAFLRVAWRRVIENSAHDSICGCSADPVSSQVLVRYAEAAQIASALASRAGAGLARRVPGGGLAVVNPSPVARTGLVEAELGVPDAWETVAVELDDGTRLGTQELGRHESLLLDETIEANDLGDLWRRFHGREIFDHAWNGYRLDSVEGRPRLTLEVDVHPDPAWLDVEGLKAEITQAVSAEPGAWRVRIVARPRRRLLASVPVPALGWRALRAIEGPGEVAESVRADGAAGLTNGLLTVTAHPDGTLDLAAADGTRVAGAGRIVDGGDRGDSYNYGPPAADRTVEVPVDVAVARPAAGPVRGMLRVTRTFEWPIGLASGDEARSRTVVSTEVVTDVELRAGEPFTRVVVSFDNRSDDHRVRLHVPLPRRADGADAEGGFAVIRRDRVPEGGYREEPLATYPALGWVDGGGMAILLEQATEYELLDAPSELAITVLRSIGLISRNAHPYRQDPAGPQIRVPAAQLRGERRMAFGLMPHAGEWLEAAVPSAAERFRHELLASPGTAPDADAWPPPQSGEPILELRGDGVVLTSLRRRGDGWLEARIVNLTDAPSTAELTGGVLEARSVSLLGKPIGGEVEVDRGDLRLTLGPAEIATVQLRRHETAGPMPEVLDAFGPRLIG